MNILGRIPFPDSPRDKDMILLGIILGFLPCPIILAIIILAM